MGMQAPDRTALQGTSEMVPGVARVDFHDALHGDFHHVGGTEMFWDAAVSETITGVTLFTDENGSDWQQTHLTPEGSAPLSPDAIELMKKDNMLGQAIDDGGKFLASLQELHKSGYTKSNSIVERIDLASTRMKTESALHLLKRLHKATQDDVAEIMQRELAAQETADAE